MEAVIPDSENYRGIVLSSAIGKVLDIIIMNRYSNELMSSNLQFSFKPKDSTVMCTAVMREIVSHNTFRNSRVYMCALDATKSFDKVNFLKSFPLLLKHTKCDFENCIRFVYKAKHKCHTDWHQFISH